MYIICVSYALGFHFKAFGMINFQYEIRVFNKFLIKPQMTKTSQDNNNNNNNIFHRRLCQARMFPTSPSRQGGERYHPTAICTEVLS